MREFNKLWTSLSRRLAPNKFQVKADFYLKFAHGRRCSDSERVRTLEHDREEVTLAVKEVLSCHIAENMSC